MVVLAGAHPREMLPLEVVHTSSSALEAPAAAVAANEAYRGCCCFHTVPVARGILVAAAVQGAAGTVVDSTLHIAAAAAVVVVVAVAAAVAAAAAAAAAVSA